MLTLWDDRGTLEPWIGPLRAGSTTGRSGRSWPTRSRSTQAGEAHRIITERRNVGKVVLIP